MEEIVYLNDELIPASAATVSAFNHGFLYGYGLFETMRTYNGAIFRLQRHLERLYRSADTLGLSTDLSAFNLEGASYSVIEANRLSDARIRITVTAGSGDIVPNPPLGRGITVFIAAQPLKPLPPESYRQGYRAVVSGWRRNSKSSLCRLKSICYTESILARQAARAGGADEALIFNDRGLLAEGSLSNIFFVQQGRLCTPPPSCGILPGITREAVLELADALAIPIQQRSIRLSELAGVDEMFLTNSILEIMPLTSIEDRPVGDGTPGPVTLQIIGAYRELVKDFQMRIDK